MEKNTPQNVRNEIFNQKDPFCLTDIINRLKETGITNEGLILLILNELFNAGFLDYKEVISSNGEKIWAFVVKD